MTKKKDNLSLENMTVPVIECEEMASSARYLTKQIYSMTQDLTAAIGLDNEKLNSMKEQLTLLSSAVIVLTEKIAADLENLANDIDKEFFD